MGRIRIAFRAADSTFAVTDAAIEKDPEFIPDIAALWVPGERKNVVRAYTQALELKRPLDTAEKDRLEEAIDRLHDLRDYPFKVVELAASVDEEQVAEVFVRINSEGVTLNQADFILTLMSVFWEKGRRQLEDFCRASKTPTLSTALTCSPKTSGIARRSWPRPNCRTIARPRLLGPRAWRSP